VPVAVPTGSYELRASLDLSPVLGVIEHAETLIVTRPPADILDRRLEELSSENGSVRRTAVYDLRYFPEDGERIVPFLLNCLKDREGSVRLAALSVLTAFPKEAAEHVDVYLAILGGGDAVVKYERASAAYLLGRVAPKSEEVEKALRNAATSDDETVKRSAEYALRTYLARTGDPSRDSR
jgi:HEAT repeat protein